MRWSFLPVSSPQAGWQQFLAAFCCFYFFDFVYIFLSIIISVRLSCLNTRPTNWTLFLFNCFWEDCIVSSFAKHPLYYSLFLPNLSQASCNHVYRKLEVEVLFSFSSRSWFMSIYETWKRNTIWKRKCRTGSLRITKSTIIYFTICWPAIIELYSTSLYKNLSSDGWPARKD